jgi:hypothetical protein
MVHAGYPQRQAIAASLSNARRHPGRDEGGGVEAPPDLPPMVPGGVSPMEMTPNERAQIGVAGYGIGGGVAPGGDSQLMPMFGSLFGQPATQQLGAVQPVQQAVQPMQQATQVPQQAVQNSFQPSAPSTPSAMPATLGSAVSSAMPSMGGTAMPFMGGVAAAPFMQALAPSTASPASAPPAGGGVAPTQMPPSSTSPVAPRTTLNAAPQMPPQSTPGTQAQNMPPTPGMAMPSPMSRYYPGMGMPNSGMHAGGVASLAAGGMGANNPPWYVRNEARNLMKGPILSGVPGRTDAHQAHVPSGSYVIPADIVSGRGQGNTIAGANVLSRLFKLGPYGSSPMGGIKHGAGPPKPPRLMAHSGGGKGGTDQNIGEPTPVNLAGGEIVVPPENLMQVVHPNLSTAHNIMDQWILNERRNLRKELAKLPGPVTSEDEES